MTKKGSSKPELHRAVQALAVAGERWPDAWSVHNEYRAHREQHGDWPEYVFAPRQAARRVMMGDAPVNSETPAAKLFSIAVIGAMAAWRPTQGIYRFAPNLLDELWDTPVTGDLPSDLLHRLPEWCVYIELGRRTSNEFVHGVWARIGYDAETREEELDLLLDSDSNPPPIIRLPLIGTVEESLDVTRRNMRDIARGSTTKLLAAEMRLAHIREVAEPVLSVLLYLCSANAEIESSGGAHARTRPAPVRRRDGELRWPGANDPTIWATGTRLGAALRRARARANAGPLGDGTEVVPHIRRAHWHAYWLGAIDSPERRRELRWLPPIPVNLDEDAPSVATVRPVPSGARGT